VIDDLPILEITSREVMARYFKKLVDCGVMSGIVKKTSSGTFTAYRVNAEIIDRLCFDSHPTKKSNPPDEIVDHPPDEIVDPKDSSTKKNSSTKMTKMYSSDSEPYRLAVLLRKEHLAIDPQYLPAGATTERVLQGWAREIDKLLRINKRDAKEVARVIHWIKRDYHPRGDPPLSSWHGWATVIMSGDKLREKYDTILPKIKNNGSINSAENSKVQPGTAGFELLSQAANRGAPVERNS
jgi:hypothetical protein